MTSLLRGFIAGLLVCAVAACASKLPYKRQVSSGALELPLDLSAITFTDLSSGEVINLRQHMEAENKQYMLLMFGSRGCAVCTQKSIQLRDDYLSNDLLFTQDAAASDAVRSFELVGVNTDPEHARSQVLQYRDGQNFDFIRWSDPRGGMLERYFLRAGTALGVPFTVLISRAGIVWRIDNQEVASVDEILARVAKSIGLSSDARSGGTKAGSDSNTKSKDQPNGDPLPIPKQGPERFRDVLVRDCHGVLSVWQALASLPQMTASGSVRFLQLTQGWCDAECRDNHTKMQQQCEDGEGDSLSACTALTLTANSGGACETNMYIGGDELRRALRSHFDWRYLPVLGDAGLVLPEPKHSWIVGFDDAGRLVYSQEGELRDDDFISVRQAAKRTPITSELARGPDFPLYSRESGLQKFADIRRASNYTVLVTFERLCESCREELHSWSEAGHLYDYCAQRPEVCQVMAVETTLPETGSLAVHLDRIEQSIRNTNNRLPLYLDPVPYGDDGEGYLQRLFDGYLTARYPYWENLYGVVIYNREGQIIADFKGGIEGMADKVLVQMQAVTR